jgi:hypothetical protein
LRIYPVADCRRIAAAPLSMHPARVDRDRDGDYLMIERIEGFEEAEFSDELSDEALDRVDSNRLCPTVRCRYLDADAVDNCAVRDAN